MQNPFSSILKKISRNPLPWAILISVLIHAILLLLKMPAPTLDPGGEVVHGPLQISLAPKQHQQEKVEPIVEEVQPQPKPPLKRKEKPKPKPVKKPPKPKQVMAVADEPEIDPEPFTVPEEIAQLPTPIEVPEIKPEPEQAVPTDMMSLIKQKREARAAQGDPSAIIALEEGKLSGQSVVKTTEDIVRENLKQPGTNGIFTITTLNKFEGVFAFQGWRGEFSNAQMRHYRVETFNAQEDIRVLMVTKMIEIIRTHYSGDFDWKSQRLSTVVTLSARQKDHKQLVRFLMEEFDMQFGYFLGY